MSEQRFEKCLEKVKYLTPEQRRNLYNNMSSMIEGLVEFHMGKNGKSNGRKSNGRESGSKSPTKKSSYSVGRSYSSRKQ